MFFVRPHRLPARLHGRLFLRAHCARRGFSLIELLVVLFIILVLLGILLPVVSKARGAAKSVTCLSNLRQMAFAFHSYAGDNGGRLPDPTGDDISWETALRKYLPTARIYECPADEEIFPSVGSSYDWRDTGDPQTTMAGRPITDARVQDFVLVFDALPNWHTRNKMNAARVDGSASAVDTTDCLTDLTRPIKGHHGKP